VLIHDLYFNASRLDKPVPHETRQPKSIISGSDLAAVGTV
jgi:hypothetical protein